jgi:hypothetical protein
VGGTPIRTPIARVLAWKRSKARDTAGAKTLYRQDANRGNTHAFPQSPHALMRRAGGETDGLPQPGACGVMAWAASWTFGAVG